jgi:hypothetical protein
MANFINLTLDTPGPQSITAILEGDICQAILKKEDLDDNLRSYHYQLVVKYNDGREFASSKFHS